MYESKLGSRLLLSRGAPIARQRWIAAVAILALSALTHIDGLFGPLHCDASAWLYMAQQRERGLLPYSDLWENKLPPIFLVYRLAWKSGVWRQFHYGWDVCWIALSGWLLWRTAWTFLQPRHAYVAAILYVIATAHPVLHYGGAIAEAHALPLVVLGFSCAALYRYSGGRWYAFLSGVAWAWAVGFRMPVALSGLGLLPLLLMQNPTPSGGTRKGLTLGIFGGAVAGLLLMLLDPVVAGYWTELFDVCIVWAFRYAVHGTHSFVSGTSALGRFLQNISIWGGLHLMAVLGFMFGLIRLPRMDAWPRIAVLALLGWYAGDLLSTFPTLHQYAHHHYTTLASTSLASVLFCDLCAVSRRRVPAWTVAVVAVGYVSWVWASSIVLKVREPSEAPGVVEAADYLRRVTEPGERVLLWVWLDESELLWRLGRPPASRHFTAPAYFMTDTDLALQSAAEMLSAPPRFAADSGAYLPLLGMPDDVIPMTPYEIIRARYRDLYERVAQFGRITIYRRKAGD